MKKIYVLVLVTSLIMFGCGTRNSTSYKHFDALSVTDNQSLGISLDKFKDVEDRSDKQNKNMTVVVAISGGGHRAGNFGVGVLTELENIKCNNKTYDALKEVDYFSTVSGGGFAAGAYIASLYDHKSSEPYSFSKKVYEGDKGVNEIKHNLERGYHNDLIEAFIKLKTLGYYDRGDYLEKEFDEKILGATYREGGKSITFGDMFIEKSSKENPKLPIWFANATIYENGCIFSFYPEAFKEYRVTKYTHNVDKVKDIKDYAQIPLSIGLKASASFPGAVPATTLGSSYDPDNGFIHLFDGGLADNLGVTTAIRILKESNNKNKVMIVIDAYNGNVEPFSKYEGSPSILQIYNRATSISLDAWRIRHKWVTDNMLKGIKKDGDKIEVIYLSFEQAENNTRLSVEEIGTNFNINSGEQKALFKAAGEVVKKNTKIIIKSLFDKECPP